MRLTAHTDFALRLLMFVGSHPERLCTIAEVAAAHDISEAHLMKVTHRLATLGYLETVRGKGGGMRLARPAQQVRLGELVAVLEPDFQLVECHRPDGRCRLTGTCRLTGALDLALKNFIATLNRQTLADLLPSTLSARTLHPMELPQ